MKALKYIGRFFLTLLITLVFVALACLAVIYIMEKGPSESAKVLFVRSLNETSRIGWISKIFLSEEEVEDILHQTELVVLEEGEKSDTSLIEIPSEEEISKDIELIDISGGSYKGKLMIVHDPSRVFVGTVPTFGTGIGETVLEMVQRYNNSGYNIIGGINGGDFIDEGEAVKDTSWPLGAVYSEGTVVQAEYGADHSYYLAGFTEDNIFVMGNITLHEADELGIRDAIYCKHDTGPFLVKDGQVLLDEMPNSATYGGGKNPRTAIGQTKDGSVLLLVVDGRQANSLGATFKDLAYIMLEYGAVNAAAMDGGTSTQMIYENEILNSPYSPLGPRMCPTAWLVKGID